MKPILVLALLSLCGSAFSQVCLEKGGTDTCTPASDGPTHCVAASQFGGPGTYPQRCGWQGSNAPFIQCKSLTDAIDTWNAGVVHYHQNDLGLIICQPPGIHDIVQTRDIVNYGAKIQEYTFKSKFSYRGATTTCPATPPELSGSARCQTFRVCPPDASGNTTPASDGMCHVPKYEACPEGNPIQCAGGAKLQTEVDFSGSGLEFKRYYSSTGFFNPRPAPQVENGLGVVWRHSYQQSIYVRQAPVGSSDISVAYVLRPNDDYRNFSLVAGQWKGRLDKPEKLEELIAGGVRTGWRYTTESDVVELYDANGILLSMTRRDGRELNFTYSLSTTPSTIAPQAGLLIAITDDFGREIKLRYNAASLIKEMIDPSNVIFGYRYDVNNKLIAVDYPGGTSRAYLYNETGLVVSPNNLLPALTGIVSETGQRYGTYKYNGIGQTIQEWHGSSGTVDKLTVSYSSSYMNSTSTTLTTDALGTVRTKKFVRIGGAVKDAGIFEPCGTPGCSGNKFTNITYDSNGYLDTKVDFKSNTTDYDFNSRGLEVRRIDAKNTSAKRITETSWSTSFRVPLERRVCAANAQNTCSTTAITPNLLSKTIYTYNSRGQVLTSTQIDPANASNTRTSTYSYCDVVNTVDCPRIGLTLAIDGPRTDVNDITTNSYRMADGVDYKKGDLWKVTSANGQVNEFLSYDGAGRVLRMLDANLVETELSYHPRGWLTSRTIKGATVGENATTTFTYTPFGAIERVTQADGAYTQYAYDDAQRLTGISDSLGNTISYILDAAGNRLSEQTKDSNNVLKRSLARQYDQLSRLRASLRAGILTTDPDTKKTTYTYDANNNSDLTTDPNISASTGTVTDNDYDPLNRLIQSIQDKATAGINARTQYGYDALDRLISVTDPKNLITSYQYDGLSNLKQLSSPDIGITLYPAYDAAGNRTEQTDARGVKSIMSYDVLNRLIKIEYKPAGSLVINAAKTVQFFYDQSSAITGCSNSFPAGRLTRFTDETGSTTFCYDRRGNVTQKTQSTNGVNFVLAMTYSKADRLLSMSYPSGTSVVYGRDGQGRISSLSVNGSAFITHVSYFPFGPVAQIDFANGRSLVKSYDQNYDIESIASPTGALDLDYSIDEVGNIKSIVQSNSAFEISYDKLYRTNQIKDQNNVLIESFAYDATGNRTQQALSSGTATYSYPASSHRLSQNGSTARSYDAAGNTTAIGALALNYDERNRLAIEGRQYNARGERVAKNVGSSTSYSAAMFSEAGLLLMVQSNQSTDPSQDYIYLDSLPVAVVEGANVYPIETDHLGTPRAVSDASGVNILWQWNLISNSASGSNVFGEQAPVSSGLTLNLRFPGQYADGNGLSYNYFRDYEPGTGRYVESDPIGLDGGINTFAYVDNKPLTQLDPLGLYECPYGLTEIPNSNSKNGDPKVRCQRPRPRPKLSPRPTGPTISGTVCRAACAAAAGGICAAVGCGCTIGTVITVGIVTIPCTAALIASCAASAGAAVFCSEQLCPP